VLMNFVVRQARKPGENRSLAESRADYNGRRPDCNDARRPWEYRLAA
jgi:hypothetical protein